MTPHELAARHPRLYHVTFPGNLENIRKFGLLSTSRLLDLFEIHGDDRVVLESTRRQAAISIHHHAYGAATINDQSPLSEKSLEGCLDDGLVARDWFELLNGRVFFWSDERGLSRLLGARANRGREVAVLVVDTLALAKAHAEKIEVSAINSGATIRKPARRGRGTYTPLLARSYEDWSRSRGRRDRILEVTAVGGVPDIADYIVEVRTVTPR